MKKVFSILTLSILLAGCNFLDEVSYTELSQETYFDTQKKVEYAVNGCYDQLQGMAASFVTCTEVPTDFVCVSPGSKHAQETRWHNGIFNYNDAWPQSTWAGLYSLIYNCNYVLDNIASVPMSEVDRNRYKAEARFLRGWAYLMLTNLFKDVPLRTTSVYNNNSYDLPLSSQEEIYDFLMEDLAFAQENLFDYTYGRSLPDSKGAYPDKERMHASVDAAIGMQALAAMYRAKNNPASPHWQTARDKAAELIARCGGVDAALSGEWLNASYNGLYHGESRYNRENLFAIYFSNSSKGEGSSLANAWAIYKNYSMANNNGYRAFTRSWYAKHFSGHYDLRNADGLMHEIINAAGKTFIWPSPVAVFKVDLGRNPKDGYTTALGAKVAGPWNSKYNDEKAPTAGSCETGVPLLRYADVLLIFAEAENEVAPASSDAYKALNAVRTRAGVGEAPAGMSGAEFRTFVLEEREREFFGECKRLFDLNRREMYGTAISKTQVVRENGVIVSGSEEYDGVNRIRSYPVKYFDIPKDEVDANKFLR